MKPVPPHLGLILLVLSGVVLAACAPLHGGSVIDTMPPAPTAQEIAAAEIGEPPSLEGIKRAVTMVLRMSLKDFESARIEYMEPGSKAILADTPEMIADSERRVLRSYYWTDPFAPRHVAWCKQVHVNAKNSYGGYTGYQIWSFYFVNGEYVYHRAPSGL
jgi:hypothetical protein